ELASDDRDRVLAAAGLLVVQGKGGEGGESGIGLRIAETMPVCTLLTEASTIGNQWRAVCDLAAGLDPPSRLHPLATFAASLANTMSTLPNDILVDDPGAVPEIRGAFPAVAIHNQPENQWPIDLDEVFDQALSETVALPGGGFLHIETTHAGVLMD